MQHPSPDRSRRNRLALLLSALTATTALSVDMSLPALPQLQAAFGVAGMAVLTWAAHGPARVGKRPARAAAA